MMSPRFTITIKVFEKPGYAPLIPGDEKSLPAAKEPIAKVGSK